MVEAFYRLTFRSNNGAEVYSISVTEEKAIAQVKRRMGSGGYRHALFEAMERDPRQPFARERPGRTRTFDAKGKEAVGH